MGQTEEDIERRKFLGAVTAASASVALNSAFTRFGGAQANAPAMSARAAGRGPGATEFPENASIVLVHAAWADGSCWSNVVGPLERHGLSVMCAPIPMTSLSDDAAALSRALERTSGPVVLAGHAYSGAVIATTKEDRVKGLVYVTALAPDEGETVAKVFYHDEAGPYQPKMVPDAHGYVWMPDDAFSRALAHKASADQAKIAAAVQRPIAVQCIQEPAPKPAWKTKPAWYLVAEEDRMINPKTQRFMAERMGAKVRPHAVDHTTMYADPKVVVEVVLEAARETLVRS
ncbi:MAG TPA: alpha/beta hydrolase [Candidatus Binatia bacterium]|nr:alpha/beta hydrolase [Candidatus Binatia bacterium]